MEQTPFLQKLTQRELDKAGVLINGTSSSDIRVNRTRFYFRLLKGSVGLGTSYEDGDWDCERLDEFFFKFLRSPLKSSPIRILGQLKLDISNALFNRQTLKRASVVGKEHYDLGNDLYAAMLDKRMIYTCGFWRDAKNLDEAQEHKLRLICEKLQLKKGERVLDIGCGWGGFAKFAAENYGVSVVGVTISKEQALLAQEACKNLPVEIRLMDYREMPKKLGTFDKIVSIGMFEHVGPKNYRAYMSAAEGCLKDDGLFLLHTIGRSSHIAPADPWIDRYIFANGMLPTMEEITRSSHSLFVIEDWHNFGADYDKTLMAWHANFEKAWPKLKAAYGENFRRRFRYYLLSCAAAFRARDIHLWQIVLTKRMLGGYTSIR